MEAGGYRPEISRARANGCVSGLRRDLLLRGTDKVSSPREAGESSEVRKGEAINFYDRKLSLARTAVSVLASIPKLGRNIISPIRAKLLWMKASISANEKHNLMARDMHGIKYRKMIVRNEKREIIIE